MSLSSTHSIYSDTNSLAQNTKAKYLKDYRPALFEVKNIELVFDLYEDHTLVTATSQLKKIKPNQPAPLVLMGEELELVAIDINGTPVDDYLLEHPGLVVPDNINNINNINNLNIPNEFTLTLVTKIHPEKNTALSGLYRSGGNFVTQCEAEGFRRITYFFDRPDVMTVYTTKIIADKNLYPVLLSNGNKIKSGDLAPETGRHYAIWQDPFKKPCYLFALVAGNLKALKDQFVTRSGRSITLEIYVREKDLPKTYHAMESLKEAMQWDEEKYDREYDLDIYMIVAVSDFNMGAMENKGLNIFNTKYILADQKTATDMDYQYIQAVVGHEYFHNWTGNRITCRDWFQLSLKEGLTVFRDQEFTSDMHDRDVKRIQDAKIIRSAQFAEDASPMAHPIRPDSYIEMNNFYTVTVYNKGAEVIRMMHTLTGDVKFRQGMDLYFKKFDGMAVTCDDFRAAISEGAQINLDQFSLWYTQAGTPIVEVQDHYDPATQTYDLIFKQSCPPTRGQQRKLPFHIPIKTALFSNTGELLLNEHCLELKKTEEKFTFRSISSRPIPSLLRNFSAPVKLTYHYEPEALGLLFAKDTDPFNRWDAGQKFATYCIDEIISQILNNTPESKILIPKDYFQALDQLLNHSDNLSSAFIAEAISLPSEATLGEDMQIILVDEIHQARELLKIKTAQKLKNILEEKYHTLSQEILKNKNISKNTNKNIADRTLKNTCLQLLMADPSKDIVSACQKQFAQADNMTDQLAALIALSNYTDPSVRENALEVFLNAWEADDLIICKWLQTQALSLFTNANTIENLLSHRVFDLKNPNKVYALLVAFTQNQKAFHNSSGDGYVLIADMVKKIDNFNPQVASRVVKSLMSWKRYDQDRQSLMKTALESILQRSEHAKISEDVYEIVSKSLD